jgi:hypothetical protein
MQHQNKKKTNATKKYYLLQHQNKATATSNSFSCNMKVLPSWSQPARKKDTTWQHQFLH